MGTHPNGPSTTLPDKKPLLDVLKQNPTLLSSKVASSYQNDLPFLFKVLSVNLALSIQAHPTKEKAVELHSKFPNIYKDPNHKPEMTVALTPFEALCGFRPLQDIKAFLQTWPEFAEVVGAQATKEFVSGVNAAAVEEQDVQGNKQLLKTIFSNLMRCDESKVKQQLEVVVKRLGSPQDHQEGSIESLFLRLNQQFPGDVGCFCALFLNYVILQPGEAMFLAANLPHAYLSGGR
jgi:mannose-6-phosphate isomerase